MNVTFSHSEQLSPSLHSFHFIPDQPLHYVAGQFIELYLPHSNPDERGDKRWFTLSSAPHEALLAITTHHGPSTFKQTLRSLQAGDTAVISAPLGDFVVPKNPDVPVLFIASGIGVTPYRSIIADELHNVSTRNISLIHAVHDNSSPVFKDMFTTRKIAYTTMRSDDLTADKIHKAVVISDDHYVYLAGPESLVERLITELVASGIKRSQLYTDLFHGYTESA